MRAERWLNWAAFATWLVVGVPTISRLAAGDLPPARAAAWTAMFVVFGAALVDCLRSGSISRPRRIVMMTIQALTGLGMMYVGVNGTASALLVIVAAEAAVTFDARGAWLWVAAQTLGIAFVIRQFDNWSDTVALTGVYAGFQAFAIAAMSLATSERAARESLSRANAELHATRSLLAENSRAAERLRISRDLHDTLGHHLTALSLQLDVASRLASGQAAEHIREAHAITKLLLADVRDVVSQMRETGRVDLGAGRESGDRRARPAEDSPRHAGDASDRRTRAGARAAAMRPGDHHQRHRHGGRANLWIRIAPQPGGIELHARDDGRGARR